MIYRRCVWALLAAAGVFAAPAAAQQGGPDLRGPDLHGPMVAPYYSGPYPVPHWVPTPTYGWQYYNPYVEPLPGYGILPPPLATLQMIERRFERGPLPPPPRVRAPLESAQDLVADVTRFRFEVTVPTADAVVLVNGAKTTQQGLQRMYVTPPLVVDKYYTYTVEAQWTDQAGVRRTEKTSFDFLLGEPTRRIEFPLKMQK